ALDPLQPRLYSIASSPKVEPGRIALTVDSVRYAVGRRTRLGVASTFLAGRIPPGNKVNAYVQKAQGFSLPADPSTPIIMVRPAGSPAAPQSRGRAGAGRGPSPRFPPGAMARQAPGPHRVFFRPPARPLRFFL